MRIYLSAYRFGPRAEVLRRVDGRALIVMNALDEYEERLLSWGREVDDLARLGYRSEELDLRDHWGGEENLLRERLAAADLLWVVGGNAFVLARAATEARLGAALARSPHLDYAGYSAGACLTSTDLRGIHMMDDDSTYPPGYRPEMRALTVNLTGTRIVPHAGSDDARAAADYLRKRDLGFIELPNGDDKLIDMPSALGLRN
ncbi:peptidase [Labedella populi]|uniref:Peptidase n=1 Tax=Labedella populi TaxID=2498850 RepID=A0A3S4CE05_9MICO|nr:Type 1 glutamine amidotransferase-like domain-containing protein [Labedella populi]RWZ67763.1 peptidase [Labedella populi]